MKSTFLYCCCLILLAACRKDATSPLDNPVFAADKTAAYTGTYTIFEEVRLSNAIVANNEFPGVVIKYFRFPNYGFYNSASAHRDSINVIAFLQTGRPNPVPWNYPGGVEDTLSFKVMSKIDNPAQDTLLGPYGYLTWASIPGRDSLNLKYQYGVGIYLYEVDQLWIKKN